MAETMIKAVEGHMQPDHVHMVIEIPPKYAVASIIGFLKGKSAIAIARQFSGKERNFTGEHFWARGYAVSTVGFDLEQIRKYVREQDGGDDEGRF
jgi:putative transposase